MILTLASTLFSVTAYSFLGFYNGFTNYAGEEKDVVAVYSKTGSTPFTGIVSIAAVNELTALRGVVAVSPETITPCMVEGISVFVRGVLPDELAELNPLSIVGGEGLTVNDTGQAMVGERLANRLGVNVGDKILVLSVLSPKYVEVQIKGVFYSDSSLNDELIVPLYMGQWLRNLSYNDATLIRAKIDPAQTSASQLCQEITNQTTSSPDSSPSPTPKSEAQQQLENMLPLTPRTLNATKIGVEESQQFMQSYLGRYGISKDSLIILSLVVLVFASGTAIVAINLFVKQHSSDINVIHCIGVSNKKIKTDLALKMITWAVVATAAGTIISAGVMFLFQRLGYLQVLSHSISFQLDPIVVVANFGLLSLLICVNIGRMELKQ